MQTIVVYQNCRLDLPGYTLTLVIANLVIGAAYCFVPLMDALPYGSARTRLQRAGTLTIALAETTFVAFRLLNEKKFHENHSVLSWTQFDRHGVEHVIVSSFDIHDSFAHGCRHALTRNRIQNLPRCQKRQCVP